MLYIFIRGPNFQPTHKIQWTTMVSTHTNRCRRCTLQVDWMWFIFWHEIWFSTSQLTPSTYLVIKGWGWGGERVACNKLYRSISCGAGLMSWYYEHKVEHYKWSCLWALMKLHRRTINIIRTLVLHRSGGSSHHGGGWALCGSFS